MKHFRAIALLFITIWVGFASMKLGSIFWNKTIIFCKGGHNAVNSKVVAPVPDKEVCRLCGAIFTDGHYCTGDVIGTRELTNLRSGNLNTAFGYEAAYSNSTANSNNAENNRGTSKNSKCCH